MSRAVWPNEGNPTFLEVFSISLTAALDTGCQVKVKLKQLTDMYQK